MSPQSNSQWFIAFACVLQQLQAVQDWTQVVNQQRLIDLAPFIDSNDPIYPDSLGSMHTLSLDGFSDSRVHLRQLDIMIHDFEQALASARGTRLEIAASFTKFRSILHPIRTLPDDILLCIFQWCTDGYEHREYRYGSLDSGHPSWTISQVCRRWRHLSLASPSLWSAVHLSERTMNVYDWDRREDSVLSRLNLQLQRSKSMPLVVTIGETYCCSYLLDEKDRLVSFLRSTTSRWGSLSVCFQPLVYGYDDNAIFADCSFDILSHLDVKHHRHSDQTISVTAFRDAPRLTHVSSVGHFQIDLDWDNIEVYMADVFSISQHSQFSSIRKLTVNAPVSYRWATGLGNFDGLPPIEFPCLCTLVLLYSDPYILNHLSMPCLETLHLRLPPSELDYPDLRQCSQHLRKLSIHSKYTVDEQLLISFLAGAPHVTELYLDTNRLLKTTMFRGVQDGVDGLFPCLESLRVDVSVVLEEGVIQEVEGIIKARLCVPEPTIRELRLIGMFVDSSCTSDVTGTQGKAFVARMRSLGLKVIYADTNDF